METNEKDNVIARFIDSHADEQIKDIKESEVANRKARESLEAMLYAAQESITRQLRQLHETT